MLRLSERAQVAAALGGVLPPGVSPAAFVSPTHRLLAKGSSEEQLLAHLRSIAGGVGHPAQLEATARALLRIGVRPRGKRKMGGGGPCSACGAARAFSWGCPCGFRICQPCVDENSWGLTCNGITWECPDCGRFRGF